MSDDFKTYQTLLSQVKNHTLPKINIQETLFQQKEAYFFDEFLYTQDDLFKYENWLKEQ